MMIYLNRINRQTILLIFENCFQGELEDSWENSFGNNIDVVGWEGETNIFETIYSNDDQLDYKFRLTPAVLKELRQARSTDYTLYNGSNYTDDKGVIRYKSGLDILSDNSLLAGILSVSFIIILFSVKCHM